jgi:sortase A
VSWPRRVETALWALGALTLGGALFSIVDSRVYQARQGRAFSESDRIASAPEARATTSVTAVPGVDPLVLGRIEIPRVGVSAIVREGDDAETLSVAVGHIPGTARPGERGNVALAGHRDSFFRALRHVRAGDVIRLRVPGRGDEYLVDSTEVVRPDETRVLASSRDAVLTLVTCYPFEYLGHAPRRFVVHARLCLRAPP